VLIGDLIAAEDIELVHGVPVGVQIVTPKWQEEKCIAVAKVVDEALKLMHGKGEEMVMVSKL
jgi:Asp-tRNA(Asn)/Glu-tRNA(Gln) amidotransferase A subunit family amidase